MTMTVTIASANCAALITDTRMSSVSPEGQLLSTRDGWEKLHAIPGGWITGTGRLDTIEAVVEAAAGMGQVWDPLVLQRALDDAAEPDEDTAFVAVRLSPTAGGFARYAFHPRKRHFVRAVNDGRYIAVGVTWPPVEDEEAFQEEHVTPFSAGMARIGKDVAATSSGVTTELLHHVVALFDSVHASGASRQIGPEVAMGVVLPTDQPGGYQNHRVVMDAADLAEALQEPQLVDFLERCPGAGARLG